jgi:hypothetical protein
MIQMEAAWKEGTLQQCVDSMIPLHREGAITGLLHHMTGECQKCCFDALYASGTIQDMYLLTVTAAITFLDLAGSRITSLRIHTNDEMVSVLMAAALKAERRWQGRGGCRAAWVQACVKMGAQ